MTASAIREQFTMASSKAQYSVGVQSLHDQ